MADLNTTPDDEMEKLRREYSEENISSGTIPDDELEELRKEYAVEPSDVGKYAEKYGKDTSMLSSGVSGLASGLSLGLSPKIIAYLNSLKSGKEVGEELKDVKGRQFIQRYSNPKSYQAGQIIGNILTGSRFPSIKGQAALGGISGYGESNKLDPRDAGGEMLQGASLGGGLQFGANILSKTPNLKEYLRSKGAESAVKAVTGGGQLNVIRDASRRPGGISRTGSHLLNVDKTIPKEFGGKTIGWFSRSDDLAEPLIRKKEFYGQAIGDIGGIVDTIEPNSVDGVKIANEIREIVNRKLADIPSNEATRNRLLNDADALAKKGSISFNEAHNLKQNYDFKGKGALPEYSDEVTNALYNSISNGMDEAVEKAKHLARIKGYDKEIGNLLSEYKNIKQKYQTFRMMTKASKEFSERELSRRFSSPSDYLMALMGGGVAAAKDANTLAALGAAGGGMMLNKLARERGRSFTANTLNTLANLMDKNPEFLNKYGTAILESVNKMGLPLAVVHQKAMENNPDYARYFEEKDNR